MHRVGKTEPFPKWWDVLITLSINESVVPVTRPIRWVSAALEMTEAISLNIIEPVSDPGNSWQTRPGTPEILTSVTKTEYS